VVVTANLGAVMQGALQLQPRILVTICKHLHQPGSHISASGY